MTNTLGALLLVVALVAVDGAPAGAVEVFHATLTGDQEVPPTGSLKTGTGIAILNDTADALSYALQVIGFDLDGVQTPGDPSDNVVGIHIHRAPFGVNGPIVFGILGPTADVDDLVVDAAAGTVSGVWDNPPDTPNLALEIANLRAGGLYFNVHTNAFPGGEIRGQILAVAVSQPGNLLLLISGLVGAVAVSRRHRTARRS